MKRTMKLLIVLAVMLCVLVGVTACKDDTGSDASKLGAPVIALGTDLSVSWDAVEGATGYIINVNGADLSTTNTTSYPAFTAAGTYTVKVQATDGTNKSDYSNEVTYTIYSVTIPTGDFYTIEGPATAPQGGEYTFTLKLDEVASESKPVVKVNGEVIEPVNGKYTVKNVGKDLVITVEGIVARGFDVTVPTGDGFTFKGEGFAVEGRDFVFEIVLDAGYSQSTPIVKVNGEVIEPVDGKYTVPAVMEELTVTVEGLELNTYNVTLPKRNLYTVEGAATVTHGEDYTFTVTLKDNVIGTMVVKANGTELTGENGKYTVSAVDKDLVITIEGIRLDGHWNVFFPENPVGYKLEGEENAKENEPYTFTLKLLPGYTGSKPVVKANGTEIKGNNGVYTTDKVTEDLYITVEGIVPSTYEVKIPDGEGYTIMGEPFAYHDKDYTFTVTLDKGYENSIITVKVNGKAVEGVDGVYTVQAVQSDLTITVEGVEVNSYKVTLPTGSGYSVSPSGVQKVPYGQSLSFTVTPNSGYEVLVKVGDTVLTGVNGKYTLEGVSADLTVSIQAYSLLNQIYMETNWITIPQGGTGSSITVSQNSTLKGEYFKKLWNAGYTHLVFTINAENGGDIIHSGAKWERYWVNFKPNTDTIVRIDISEYRENGQWMDMPMINMSSNATITKVKAYKSPETLQWKKVDASGNPLTNVYFAIEDGYYVLETRQAGAGVVSPTEWLKKYCVNDEAGQRTWFVYADWLYAGDNYRSGLWGFGTPVHCVFEDLSSGWQMMSMKPGAYTPGDVFSWNNEMNGISRFKFSDIVSSRSSNYTYTQIDDLTFKFSTALDGHTFRLASTPELVAQGYKKLVVTLTGELKNGAMLWYGNDDWSDGEIGITAGDFVNGKCVFEVDLSTMNGNVFSLMTNKNTGDGAIVDMTVHIEPSKDAMTVTHIVNAPAENPAFTFSGPYKVMDGDDCIFTVTINDGYQGPAIVKVNGNVVEGVNGTYTVKNVKEDLTITVEGLSLKTYNVTIPTGDGYKVTGETTVTHGETYTFTLEVLEAYTQSTPVVKVNGNVVTGENGTYTVANVQSALTIAVEGVAINTYNVTLAENDSLYTIAGEATVQHGATYTFTVTVKAEVIGTVVVKANGNVLTGNNGTYTIENVTEDLSITVDGIHLPGQLTVTKPVNPVGYTVEGADGVTEGDDYTFTVTILPGYQGPAVVKVNGNVVEPVQGVYTVENVAEDLIITVEGVTVAQYSVFMPTDERYIITPAGTQTVEHGGSLSFTIASDEGLMLTVKANGTEIKPVDGVYTVSNITENISITVDVRTVGELLLNPENWTATTGSTSTSLTIAANATMSGKVFEELWEQGYTHLVFSINGQSGGDIIHSGAKWDRQWINFAANTAKDVRIDISEYLEGGQWMNMPIINMSATATLTNVRAYKSPETLLWKKIDHNGNALTNIYFAVEDGCYVLETRQDGAGVASPTQWLAKYLVTDDANQRTMFGWAEYINRGNNTRGVGFGWGSIVHVFGETATERCASAFGINDKTAGTDVFSLHLLCGGTARIKMYDWVSNRNQWNAALKLEHVDDYTYIWSGADSYKIRYVPTQDLIAQGYDKLKVTLTGNLGSATLWYGEDDWSDGEIAVAASAFTGGSYTFEVDLTTFKANENFTMMLSGGSMTDLRVKIVPVDTDAPVEPEIFNVTAPTGDGFTFQGEATVEQGEDYVFTVTPDNAAATVTVKVNGNVVIGEGNTYTIANVQQDLTITVEVEVPVSDPVADVIFDSASWTATSSTAANSITVPNNAQLLGTALKELWDQGYTHLVFTVTPQSGGNAYLAGGSAAWDAQWFSLTAGTAKICRMDISELLVGEVWSNLLFCDMTGTATISDVKAYKSPETLEWTKSNPNCYFAIEDGYYVLDTRGGMSVKSPTEWLKKYCVTDDASQRSWRVYTDYLDKGGNTRSMVWGWGDAVNIIHGSVDGGWTWLNGVQTDGYTDGEVFSLHLDAGGTARFKIADWVSNRNEWNADLKLDYVDENTYIWSGNDSYKIRLATTQDLIAQGYTKLNVTLTGDLGSALIWYGEDDWSDGEVAIGASAFTGGSYTFEVDLTTFKAGEVFTMMGNAAKFTDLTVKIEPVK